MTENNIFKNKQVNLLLRDGFAAEIYFGNIEGEHLNVDDAEGISPVIKTLAALKSKNGYKTMLYLDALARQMDYYCELSDMKDSLANPLLRVKPPLYFPQEVLDTVECTLPSAIVSARSQSEEIIIKQGKEALKNIHDFHNNKLVPAFISYISSEGNIGEAGGSSPKMFFLKASENKHEAIEIFKQFKSKIKKNRDVLSAYGKLLKLDGVLDYINRMKMANALLPSTEEEKEIMVSFVAKRVSGADSRIILSTNDNVFYFSPLSHERPPFNLNFIGNENVFTFTDLMLYSEVGLKEDEQKAEILNQIRIFHEIYNNNTFGEKISEMIMVGEKYAEAYRKNGVNSKAGDKLIERTYQMDAYEALLDQFLKLLEKNITESFENIVTKELSKSSQKSIFSTNSESFGFMLAAYVIKQSVLDKLSALPLVGGDIYRSTQDKKLKQFILKKMSELVPLYIEKRSEYVKSILEKGEAIKNTSDQPKVSEDKKDEKQGSQPKKEQKPKVEPEKDTIQVKKDEDDADEDDDAELDKEAMLSALDSLGVDE